MKASKGKGGKKTPKKNKKPTVVGKKPTTSKKPKQKRKRNRYNAVMSAVSKYCKDTYGIPCPRDEMNRVYNDLKSRHTAEEWSKDYKVINDVIQRLDYYIRYKDADSDAPMPSFNRSVDWFNIIDKLMREDGLYFKEDDTIVLRMGDLDLGDYEVKHKDLDELYYHELYNKLRSREYEITSKTGKGSPVSSFVFNEGASDVGSRKYVFDIDIGHDLTKDERSWSETFTQGQSIPMPESPESILSGSPMPSVGGNGDELKVLQLKKDLAELRHKDIDNLNKMLEMTIITKGQYKAEYDKIMSKYGKGGQV